MSTLDQTPDVSVDDAVSLREAAGLASVTDKTLRRWIKSGRLYAVKLGGQYRITLADLERAKAIDVDNAPQQMSTQRLDTGQTAPPIDLRPLVDHLATLEGQVQQLTEAAAVWQVRALQAEEQLKQQTAGGTREHAAQRTPDTPHDEQGGDMADAVSASWWRRWWRSLTAGA
jgi:excisionase family DNA binding protein